MSRESMLPRVQRKHLKWGSVVTLVAALIGAPGFWAWMTGGDKADAAYAVLQAEIDYGKANDVRIFNEISTLRTTMIHLYARPAPVFGNYILDSLPMI